jgi:transposase
VPDIQSALPNDVNGLKALIFNLKTNQESYERELQERDEEIRNRDEEIRYRDEEIRYRDEEIERLKEINLLLRIAKYASSQSERDINQLEFFNEAELENEIAEKSSRIQVKAHTKSKPKRKPLPDNLPREKVVIALPENQRQCSCGCQLKEIGSETSEKLDMIPAQFKVIQTTRMKYSCSNCDLAPIRAPLPPEIIPKSNATPGLLASIAVSKYADALPLYRQEKIFARHGIDLPRSTTSSWMVKCGQAVIPLINLAWDEMISESYLQMDETRLQVLKEPGKKPTSKSWMWTTARAGPKPIIIFEYDPTRSKSVPNRLLEGFEGYLQCDGFASYNEFCKRPRVIRVGCGYHIRRKFKEAAKVTKKKKKKGLAQEVVNRFKLIFEIEEIAREQELSSEERYALRHKEAKPLLLDLKRWLDEKAKTILPKGKLGKAIQYARNEWENFIRYLDDGRLEIGTIFVENKIRPVALGRRNWLFCDTVGGANASAGLYSLVETAKANDLNPYKYLKHIFEELPKARSADDYEKLLPWKIENESLKNGGF